MTLETSILPQYGSRATGRERGVIFSHEMRRMPGLRVPNKVPGGSDLIFGGTERVAQDFDRMVGPAIYFEEAADASTTEELVTAEGTVAMWVKLRTLPAGGGLAYIQHALGGATTYHIYIPRDGTGALFTQFGNVAGRDTGVRLDTNKWYRIVVRWVNRTPPEDVWVYVDGEEVDQYTTTIASNAAPTIMTDVEGEVADYLACAALWSEREVASDYIESAYRCQYDCMCNRFRVSSADEGGVIGQHFSNTPWRFGDTKGRWRIVDIPELGPDARAIECQANGILYLQGSHLNLSEPEAAYGTMRFMLDRGPGMQSRTMIVASVPEIATDAAQNGYSLVLTNLDKALVYEITAGVLTAVFASPIGAVTGTWHDWSFPRRTRDGRYHVIADNAIVTPDGAWTNPFFENTHKESKYFVMELQAGDRIAKVRKHFGELI